MSVQLHPSVTLSPLAYAREADRLRVEVRRERAFACCFAGDEARRMERHADKLASRAHALQALALQLAGRCH